MRASRVALGFVAAGLAVASAARGAVTKPDSLRGPAPRFAAAPPSPVRVIVEESPGRFGGATYRYLVINDSNAPITTVLIGFDDPTGIAELRLPRDWSGESPPVSGSTSPDGWHFYFTRTEEDSVFNLAWEIDDDSHSLWSGQRLAGLSVTIPAEDTLYETAHWMAILNSGAMTSTSGALERRPHQHGNSFPDDPDIHVTHDATWRSVTIQYEVEDAGDVEVAILGSGATLVRKLFHDETHAGKNKVAWDGLDDRGRAVTPGTYYVRVRSGGTERFARFTWHR